MAAVQARDRAGATKKPFGWLQRLYKRSSATDADSRHYGSESTRIFGSQESPFLDTAASVSSNYAGNDSSSLRPTISTRPPSMAGSDSSHAAIHNVDAISSPVTVRRESAQTRSNSHTSEPSVAPPIHRDITTVSPTERNKSVSRVSSEHHDQHVEHRHNSTTGHEDFISRQTSRNYSESNESSKDSPIPSIFTARTVETQPTISHLAHPASILSSRTGGGLGANDNASMLTLASSSKGPRRRRNSTDTNCSVLAIAPASARASFDSSRTGVTDHRRPLNTNSLVLSDDMHNSTSTRNIRPNDANSSRRSVSGLSAMSDTRSNYTHADDKISETSGHERKSDDENDNDNDYEIE